MKCPSCGTPSMASASSCSCGYSFDQGRVTTAASPEQEAARLAYRARLKADRRTFAVRFVVGSTTAVGVIAGIIAAPPRLGMLVAAIGLVVFTPVLFWGSIISGMRGGPGQPMPWGKLVAVLGVVFVLRLLRAALRG